MIKAVGIEPPLWFAQPGWALFTVALVNVFKQLGFVVILYLSSLKSIPESLFDAAEIDGANEWHKARYVIWPLVLPTTFFISVILMINAFSVFEQIYVLTFGGPEYSTYVIPFFIYDVGLFQLRMGYASAAGIVLMVIMIIITLVQNKYFQRRWASF